MAAKIVLVTGGNAGIGLALCRQLAAKEYGCRVLLCARSADKGKTAVQSILKDTPDAKIDWVELDVGDDKSVTEAAQNVTKLLAGSKLYGIVNNAGIGGAIKCDTETMLNTNTYGPKRVLDAFLPLIAQSEGRVVNVGSGAGPNFVKKKLEAKENDKASLLTSWETTWAQLDQFIQEEAKGLAVADPWATYGMSKASLTVYTMMMAKQFKQDKVGIKISCVTPGFINTKLTAGFGATLTPAEGTKSILHCLFDELPGNGFYYGSDGVRSPLTYMRNPGEPEYKPADESEKKYQ